MAKATAKKQYYCDFSTLDYAVYWYYITSEQVTEVSWQGDRHGPFNTKREALKVMSERHKHYLDEVKRMGQELRKFEIENLEDWN